MDEKFFEVRDLRSKEKFFVDDAYLNGYARLCGWKATLVYLCLCRHADRNQQSLWNIVHVDRGRFEDGKIGNNIYTLLDKKEWQTQPKVTQASGQPNATGSITKRHTVQIQTPHSRYKDTHIKDTHKKERLSFLERVKSGEKPKYDGMQMRSFKGRIWCLPKDGGEWLEFVGNQADIKWA